MVTKKQIVKKHLIIFGILSILLTLSVSAIEPYFYVSDKPTLQPTSLYIGRTDPSKSEVKKGELLNAQYEIGYRIDSSQSVFSLYFFNGRESGNVYFFRNAYYTTPRKKGEILYVNAENFDTKLLPNEWCNTLVAMGGFHYICPVGFNCGSFDISPIIKAEDYKQAVSLGSVWILDNIHRGELEGGGSRFKLLCGTSDPCLSKKEQSTNQEYCIGNSIYEKIYNGATLTDGSCATGGNFVDDCKLGKCSVSNNNAVCITSSTKLADGENCISLGDSVCQSGNCIVTTCSSEKRDNGDGCFEDNDCSSNICLKNLCREKELPPKTELTEDEKDNSLKGKTCKSNLYCDNGDIMIPCNKGVYGDEKKCLDDEKDDRIIVKDRTKKSGGCTKFQTVKDNKCSFNASKFFKDKTVLVSLITGFVFVVSIIFIISIPKKKKR